MIVFNKAVCLEESEQYVRDALHSRLISGDRKFSRLCAEWMEHRFKARKVMLTTSGTAALEMAALLLDIKNGDEVIMPSYTFTSTANAFALRGAKIVFVDIRPDTMNADEHLIENAISKKTRAIVVVHYAGVGCEMEAIMDAAHKHNIPVVEDAAQGVMAYYKDRSLGTIGTIGCFSFHETKNYSMGEGGAVVINDPDYIERAEIIREKGTDRSRFFRGQVDKYTWVDIGSSYLPSDINAAFLYAQLQKADEINDNRLAIWNQYYDSLIGLYQKGVVELPCIPPVCRHNGHMFYIKVRDIHERTRLLTYLKNNGITAVFHYIPLHITEAGKKYGTFRGEDAYTTRESQKLLRLPFYYGLPECDIQYIACKIKEFYNYKEE